MKTKLIGLGAFALTAIAVGFYPQAHSLALSLGDPAGSPVTVQPAPPVSTPQPGTGPAITQAPKVEVVFVLDTTGSMGGLIGAAKEKIWSIATTMGSAQQAPEIRMGLVAYRDRGDAYITQVTDLSSDLDSVYSTLMGFRAQGGGDGPESVNAALFDAVQKMSWSAEKSTYRAVFLVGDAPPHMDYPNEMQYPEILEFAKSRGIVVNAIQSGNSAQTRTEWTQIAQLGGGEYFDVDQDGSVLAIATPFDKELAVLSARLDATKMFYGSAKEREQKAKKSARTAQELSAVSAATQARRAAFNASPSGILNMFSSGSELLEDVTSGAVTLDAIPTDELPAPIAALPEKARAEAVSEAVESRKEMERQMADLVGKRDRYLDEQVKALGGAKDSLDHKLYDAVRKQAAGVGLTYESGPKY